MLPVSQFNKARVNDLNWYLIQELRRAMGDRGTLEADWVRYEQLYRGRPIDAEKDFPFDGASNLVVGVVATDVDTLYARTAGMLVEPGNLWNITALRPEMMDFAAATNEFLEWAQHNELDVHGWLGDWIIDIHKLGTGILKQRYTRDMRKVYEWREMDNGQTWQQQAVMMLHDHPSVHHVRLHDFYIPAGFKKLQEAPWCAERIRMTWPRFMNRVKAGIYTNADAVGSYFFNPSLNQVQSELDRISRYQASVNQQLELYEFWLDFDIDGDGWDEALLCTIHLESQTYVRIDYNPWFNQEKPYSAARFMRDVNGFYGIGLGEILEYYQEEITAMHNQRIDSGTVANSTQYVMDRADLPNVGTKPKSYPTKVWALSKPEAFKMIGMGSGNGLVASIEMEQATRAEAQRRDGVNDYIQGNPGPQTSYAPAYTTQQMSLNSSKRQGETFRDIREALSETGTRVLELYQQYNPRGKEFMALGQKDGSLVAMVLRFPLDLIRKGLRVSVTAIDAETSKDAQIRTQTLVMQQLMQFYNTYMTMISYAANPQMPPILQQTALQAAQGSAVLMRRLLELMGRQDATTLVPELQGAVNAQQQQLANIQSLLGNGGTAGVPQGPGQAPGMAGAMAPGGAVPSGVGPGQAPNTQGSGGALPGSGGASYV